MTWTTYFGIIYREHYFYICEGSHDLLTFALNNVEYAQFCAKRLLEKYSQDELRSKLDDMIANRVENTPLQRDSYCPALLKTPWVYDGLCSLCKTKHSGRWESGWWERCDPQLIKKEKNAKRERHEANLQSEYGVELLAIFSNVISPGMIEQYRTSPCNRSYAGIHIPHYEKVLEKGKIMIVDKNSKYLDHMVKEDVGTAKVLTAVYPKFMADGHMYDEEHGLMSNFASFVNLDKGTLEITFSPHMDEIFGNNSPTKQSPRRWEMPFVDCIFPLDTLPGSSIDANQT